MVVVLSVLVFEAVVVAFVEWQSVEVVLVTFVKLTLALLMPRCFWPCFLAKLSLGMDAAVVAQTALQASPVVRRGRMAQMGAQTIFVLLVVVVVEPVVHWLVDSKPAVVAAHLVTIHALELMQDFPILRRCFHYDDSENIKFY